MKKITLLLICIAVYFSLTAQNIQQTKIGKISFYSKAKSPEKVEADNNEVSSILNTQTGDYVFQLLMKGFHFKKAFMEEHFNENYLETKKYPKSTFKGKITNLSSVNFTKDGAYTATVDGDLIIHGVTKKITTSGTITVKSGKISATSKFTVKVKDYNISIPTVVADKVSEDIDVIIDCKYEPKS